MVVGRCRVELADITREPTMFDLHPVQPPLGVDDEIARRTRMKRLATVIRQGIGPRLVPPSGWRNAPSTVASSLHHFHFQ